MVRLNVLFWLGKLAEMSALLRRLLEDARERGDRMQEITMRAIYPHNIAWLAADEPETFEQQLDRVMAWVTDSVGKSSFFEMMYEAPARGALALYRGRADRSRGHVDRVGRLGAVLEVDH